MKFLKKKFFSRTVLARIFQLRLNFLIQKAFLFILKLKLTKGLFYPRNIYDTACR